jgi:signal transduction histidine kinase
LKIKFKITTLFAILVSAILLLLSFSVYYFSSLERLESYKKRLRGRATNNAQIFSLFGDTDSGRAVLTRIDATSAFPMPHKSVNIYNENNQPVYVFNTGPGDSFNVNKNILEEARAQKEVYFTYGNRDAIAIYYVDNKTRFVAAVAGYDEDGWNRLNQLRDILLVSLFIGIATALIVGYVFSVQLVKPIAQIIHEVKDISSQNLSHRIQAGQSQDELNQLANTFNDLLNRLQESFAIQRRFISNASHELSTPLTSISSQLEVTLHRERSMEEYRQVMQSIREDVQHMQLLTKSLLEIAKTGSQGGIELSEIRIDEVLFKTMADVKKIAPEYNVDLHFGDFPDDERSFLVFGNYELLYISLKNIVENGCKYSPDHLSWVELLFRNDEVIIYVKNKGDIIAEEEIENIFQPFYRATTATAVKGFGLGLALAKRIIAIHKGSIDVRSDLVAGTIFSITLPSLKAFAEK